MEWKDFERQKRSGLLRGWSKPSGEAGAGGLEAESADRSSIDFVAFEGGN